MAIDEVGPRSRRALLGGGLGALAALAANALGRAVPVSAANGEGMQVGGFYQSTQRTALVMTNNDVSQSAIVGTNMNNGTGISGTSGSGYGIQGTSTGGTGVFAGGVHGYGIKAHSTYNYAVWGDSPDNYGVYGTSSTSYAVVGLSNSSIGVVGQSSSGGGVFGLSGGDAPGVEGRSNNGRGGLFGGKAAQIRLVPSNASSHPASGSPGDIFLDKSKRLWLCKGGTTWVRLDT